LIARSRALDLLERFETLQVLVVGDVMLDRYLWGEVDRISPEAPVPVVQVTRESAMLGGAGNVARTLASLGARSVLVALIGDDDTGREISDRLADWKIDASGIIVEPSRPTTVKTRVIARAQQMVRFDRECEEAIGPGLVARVIDRVQSCISGVDGVILQDYGKGLLERETLERAMAIFAERDVSVFVDPKLTSWDCYRGAALIKPNLREARLVTGSRIRDDAELAEAGRDILERTGAETLAITRGAEGMTLFYAEGGSEHVPTAPRPVAEASGAGDTAIAMLSLARLAGASWAEAASLANAAAGVVVGVAGTAAVTQAELLAALSAEP
jgi:D-beta-D-heptose 7-phosphate kinase/D-beta-D-heptose 1-phosphate adenosyltransferase